MVGNVLEVDIASNPKIKDLQKGQNSKFNTILFFAFFGFLCFLALLSSPFFFSFFSPKFLIRNLIVVVLRIIPYLNIQVGNQQVGRSNEVKFLAAKQFFSLLFFIILLVFLMCFFPYFLDFFSLFMVFFSICSCIIYILFNVFYFLVLLSYFYNGYYLGPTGLKGATHGPLNHCFFIVF